MRVGGLFPLTWEGNRKKDYKRKTEMILTREERETIIRTSDADGRWVISTASPRFIRKFTKLGYQMNTSRLNLDGYNSFEVPLNLVSFRRPHRKPSTPAGSAET
jgi:hypothetical protein